MLVISSHPSYITRVELIHSLVVDPVKSLISLPFSSTINSHIFLVAIFMTVPSNSDVLAAISNGLSYRCSMKVVVHSYLAVCCSCCEKCSDVLVAGG